MTFSSLQTRLVVIFSLCLLGTIGAITIYDVFSSQQTDEFIINSSKEAATSSAQDLLFEEAKSISYVIRVELESALDVARTLADVLSGIKDQNIDLRIDREKINGILRSVLIRNPIFLGTYTVWEPDALDGLDELYVGREGYDQTGRFMTYWNRSQEGEIQHEIPINYDNHETYENGVRKGEYYLLPYERKRECVIEPFPAPAQDQIVWMTSLVVPIMVNEIFYGITGVDIRLDFIQALVEQTNSKLYAGVGKMGIISHNGILAASSDQPEFVGKHLKHWMPDAWQEALELIHSNRQQITVKDASVEINVPLNIGRTQTPWAVFIKIPTDAVLTNVHDLERELRTRSRYNLIWQVSVGLGITLLALIVIWFVSKSITNPLKTAATVAAQVSEGNLGIQFDSRSKDEVGQVLRAMGKMIAYLKDVANVAEKISNNDLQIEITPKSEEDELSHSLIKMVGNLQTMTNEIERSMAAIEEQYTSIKEQNWSKDGISQLNAVLVGEHSLKEICDEAISFVARYVNAGQGVLYTYNPEQDRLSLNGSFAFTERDGLSNHYKAGEGIIGQVALERAPILLKHLSREERLINTATLSEPPLTTYTAPLVYNDELYGVLELASFEAFDEKIQSFVQQTNSIIATALFSAIQRERGQKLIELAQQATQEAERVKEELLQQAVEAEETNARLREQQHQLEQQREELHQQQEALAQTGL